MAFPKPNASAAPEVKPEDEVKDPENGAPAPEDNAPEPEAPENGAQDVAAEQDKAPDPAAPAAAAQPTAKPQFTGEEHINLAKGSEPGFVKDKQGRLTMRAYGPAVVKKGKDGMYHLRATKTKLRNPFTGEWFKSNMVTTLETISNWEKVQVAAKLLECGDLVSLSKTARDADAAEKAALADAKKANEEVRQMLNDKAGS